MYRINFLTKKIIISVRVQEKKRVVNKKINNFKTITVLLIFSIRKKVILLYCSVTTDLPSLWNIELRFISSINGFSTHRHFRIPSPTSLSLPPLLLPQLLLWLKDPFFGLTRSSCSLPLSPVFGVSFFIFFLMSGIWVYCWDW